MIRATSQITRIRSEFALQTWQARTNLEWRMHTQSAPEHQAYRGGSTMVWTGVSQWYRIGIHIISAHPVSSIRIKAWTPLWDCKLQQSVFISFQYMIMRILIKLWLSTITWRVRGFFLIPLKVLGMPFALLHVKVSHLRQLSQSCELLYRMSVDYLTPQWLMTS